MIVYLKLVLTTMFWGGTFVAGRVLSRELGPFEAAFLRFFLASLFLMAMTWKETGQWLRLPRKNWPLVILLGMTGVFAYNVFFFQGLKTVAAGRAALIIALNPVGIALASALFMGERLTLQKALGIAVCLCGAAVVLARGNPLELLSGGLGLGELCLLGCVLSWTLYSVLGKRALGSLSPLQAVTGSCLAGALLLLPFALAEGLPGHLADLEASQWAGLAYLAVCGTGLGFSWYYQGLRAIGPTRAGVFINLVPVTAVTLGVVLLGESLSGTLVSGAALVVTGLFLTNTPRLRVRRVDWLKRGGCK